MNREVYEAWTSTSAPGPAESGGHIRIQLFSGVDNEKVATWEWSAIEAAEFATKLLYLAGKGMTDSGEC